MEYLLKTVPIQSINLEDKTFVTATGANTDLLQRSIEKAGLLNPPYLSHVLSGDYYRIVCGYLRIKACIALGWRELPARIIAPDSDGKDIFLISLYDNLSHRAFNAIEQAAITIRLLKNYQPEQVIKEYLPLLGLPPTAKTLDTMCSLAALEPEVQNAVVQGNLAEAVAIKLAHCNQEDRLSFFELFSQIHLSASKQEEIFASCLDIAVRNGISCKAVVRDEAIQEIVALDKLTVSQKGDRIRAVLKKRRSPHLSQSEEKFLHLSKKLHLPEGVQLSPPPFFEGGSFRLQIEFDRVENLQNKIERLKDITNNQTLKHILDE